MGNRDVFRPPIELSSLLESAPTWTYKIQKTSKTHSKVMDISANNPPLTPDENRGFIILVISWLSVAITIVFVVCRLYTRLKITRNAALDDIIVTASVVLFIITVAITSASVSHGLGRHIVHLQPDQITYTLYLSAILQPIGIFAFILPKLAVAMLIIKLMGPQKHGIWFLYLILTILTIASALSSILLFVQCDPPSHFWHPTEPAKCWPPSVLMNMTLFQGSWSAFVDLSLALFPVTVFWNLKIKRSRKVGISILMGFGIFAMVCAIVKTTCLPQEEQPDFTWDVFGLWIWTYIETAVVIICACIPTLPQLVLLLLRKGRKATQYETSRHMQSPPAKSKYDHIYDRAANLPCKNEVEMLQGSNDSSMTRTESARTHWELV